MCTLARACLVGHSVTMLASIDVVWGERALHGTGLLGVDLLCGSAGLIAGAWAGTGVGRAIWQNWTFSWRAGRTGSTLTCVQKKEKEKRKERHSDSFSPHTPTVFSTWHHPCVFRLTTSKCLLQTLQILSHTHNHHINHLSTHQPNPHTFPLSSSVKIVFKLLHHWIEQFSSL